MYGVAQVPNYRSFFDMYLELIFPGNWCYSFVFQNNFYTAPYGTFNHTFKKFWLMFCGVWFYMCLITQSYLQNLHLMQSFTNLSLWHMISCCLYLGLTFGPPYYLYNRCLTLFILVVCSGSSETKVFDEKSPSGNDYLAEVLIILPSPVCMI